MAFNITWDFVGADYALSKFNMDYERSKRSVQADSIIRMNF